MFGTTLGSQQSTDKIFYSDRVYTRSIELSSLQETIKYDPCDQLTDDVKYSIVIEHTQDQQNINYLTYPRVPVNYNPGLAFD